MRGRSDGAQKKRLLTSVAVVAIFFVVLYFYFGSKSNGESALEYGSRSLRKLGSSYLGGDDESDLSSKQDEKFGLEDGEDGIVSKSFPVSIIFPFVLFFFVLLIDVMSQSLSLNYPV